MDFITSLGLFGSPKAKIDCLTISRPASLDTMQKWSDLKNAITGRIQTPAPKSKRKGEWIAIHDPHVSDLQWLLDNHPEARILEIEIAVDFTLLDNDSGLKPLRELHGLLKTRLFPERH